METIAFYHRHPTPSRPNPAPDPAVARTRTHAYLFPDTRLTTRTLPLSAVPSLFSLLRRRIHRLHIDLARLDRVLDGWPAGRRLMFCDEAAVGAGLPLEGPAGPWAILIGPEGGFSEAERTRLRGLEYAHRVSLGPRILRADTAAVAALTLWQTQLGDWK